MPSLIEEIESVLKKLDKKMTLVRRRKATPKSAATLKAIRASHDVYALALAIELRQEERRSKYGGQLQD